jgi:predicted phosphodiesterase
VPAAKFTHAVPFGDTHVPYHDEKALAVVKKIITDVRPEVVVHMGDLIDCWQISTFDKDPANRDHLQDNIDESAKLLREIAMVTPGAERYVLEGNHEFRLTKTINRAKDGVRELMGLRVAQRNITWQAILEDAGIESFWEWVPHRRQTHRRIFPNLITKHGSIVRKWSGMTARGEWERYGKSGMSGHTHRLGLFYHNDFNGAHGWVETGCTCDLNPDYVEDPDWQHGCVIVTFAKDYKYFSFEPVYIQEGHAMWRDNRYSV